MANKQITFETFMLSTDRQLSFQREVAYTNDVNSVQLSFDIKDLVDLTAYTPNVLLYMQDGSFYQITTGITKTGTTVSYTLKGNEGKHNGLVRVQLILISGTTELASAKHEFRIEAGLDTVVATEVMIQDWTTLTKEAGDFIAEMRTNETQRQTDFDNAQASRQSTFNTSESNRQSTFNTNEQTRQVNEDIRVSSEDTRGLSESERISNEQARITAEGTRTAQEQSRVSAEEQRAINEQARIIDAAARNEELTDSRFSGYSGHTYDNLGQRLDTMESAGLTNAIVDFTNAPGSKALIAGTRENGFYGFVQPQDIGQIESNPAGSQAFNGANLALNIGLSAGTSINSETAWMKFSRRGEIYLVPVKPLRHSVTWNAIYNQGAVYGTGGVGVNPPNGRAGNRLSVVGGAFTISRSAADGFLQPNAVLGAVGQTIVARGFSNAANNGEFVIQTITDTAITVAATLVDEASAPRASIYEKTRAVNQNRDVVIGGNRYRVQLLKGSAQDPLNSFADADRDMVGPESEWNHLILPMHERAKLQNWRFPAHAGTTENWGLGLTDADLVTHGDFGLGSFSWTQETSNVDPYLRVLRGHHGVSHGSNDNSWGSWNALGWRPILRLLP